MAEEKSTQKDVQSWELSDELWEKIEPFLPKPKSRFRGRGKKRRNVGGRPPAQQRKIIDHGRHPLCAADWLPVECRAQRVWFRQDPASIFSALGASWNL